VRARFIIDRDGNLVEQPLPAADFEQFNRDADVAQRTFEIDVRDLGNAVRAFAAPAPAAPAVEPVPTDSAGHRIGNYL
jgi:hypothetical protein